MKPHVVPLGSTFLLQLVTVTSIFIIEHVRNVVFVVNYPGLFTLNTYAGQTAQITIFRRVKSWNGQIVGPTNIQARRYNTRAYLRGKLQARTRFSYFHFEHNFFLGSTRARSLRLCLSFCPSFQFYHILYHTVRLKSFGTGSKRYSSKKKPLNG